MGASSPSKTIDDVLAMTPGALVAAGLGGPALRDLAKAATELGLTWRTSDEIASAAPADTPVALDIPKAILALGRPTFVLEEWTAPSKTPMAGTACTTCARPLELLETIGQVPRVGRWPCTMHALSPWPSCCTCQERRVLAFQLPGEEQQELVFECPKGCTDSGLHLLATD